MTAALPSAVIARQRSRIASSTSRARAGSAKRRSLSWCGDSMTTSCRPVAGCASPSRATGPGTAGATMPYRLGTTRTRQGRPSPAGTRSTSGGVMLSFPGQNGHGAAPVVVPSVGRPARSGATMCQSPVSGSIRYSAATPVTVAVHGDRRVRSGGVVRVAVGLRS
jgi:hypothetical protein